MHRCELFDPLVPFRRKLATRPDLTGPCCLLQVPFLARRYFSRPSARQQLASQRQMQGSAEAPEPLWGAGSADRPRPTQGWRPASGRLAPISRPMMRMCDVETSLRPTNPEYFQDTYEALLGRQHRCASAGTFPHWSKQLVCDIGSMGTP